MNPKYELKFLNDEINLLLHIPPKSDISFDLLQDLDDYTLLHEDGAVNLTLRGNLDRLKTYLEKGITVDGVHCPIYTPKPKIAVPELTKPLKTDRSAVTPVVVQQVEGIQRRSQISEESHGCPDCKSTNHPIEKDGGVYCGNCGFVYREYDVDTTPQRKAYNLEEKLEGMGFGPPRTQMLHDYGLSTYISRSRFDATGQPLSSEMMESAYRLGVWQHRLRASSNKERTMVRMLERINYFAEVLNLPQTLKESTAHEYRKLLNSGVVKSKHVNPLAVALLYKMCRNFGVIRTLNEVSKITKVPKNGIAKYYRLILKIKEEYVPPPPIEKCISKIINTGKINVLAERLAIQIVNNIDPQATGGKNPMGLAAASVYVACRILGEYEPQREIAEIAGVTEITVRNRVRTIMESCTIIPLLKEDKNSIKI